MVETLNGLVAVYSSVLAFRGLPLLPRVPMLPIAIGTGLSHDNYIFYGKVSIHIVDLI
jgi:hypothetical protein